MVERERMKENGKSTKKIVYEFHSTSFTIDIHLLIQIISNEYEGSKRGKYGSMN
jgi:hypothetical protein